MIIKKGKFIYFFGGVMANLYGNWVNSEFT